MARTPTLDAKSSIVTTGMTVAKTVTADSGYSTGCNTESGSGGSKIGSGGSGDSGSGGSQSHSGSSRSSGYDGPNNEFMHPRTSCGRAGKKKKKTPPDCLTQVVQKDNVPEEKNEEPQPMDVSKVDAEKSTETGSSSPGSQPVVADSLNHNLNVTCLASSSDVDYAPSSIFSELRLENLDALFGSPLSRGKFAVEIGMKDGIVQRQTESLGSLLGYPERFWLGRQFLRLIREKDRDNFGKYITSVMVNRTQPFNYARNSIIPRNSKIFCCLREYRGLSKGGFGVMNKDIPYLPCLLTAFYRDDSSAIVIKAKILKKAYKAPLENLGTTRFYTTQSAECNLIDMDSQAVRYLGHLPQDILGQCVLNFYHPEDWPIIKDLYDSVLAETRKQDGINTEQNSETPWSQPYRFRSQNGDWVVVKTKFARVFNICTQQLHSLIGNHCIIRGPSNPDVFATPLIALQNHSSEVVKDWSGVAEMIKDMKRVHHFNDKQHTSHNSKHLASFVKTFVEYVSKSDKVAHGSSSTRVSLKGSADNMVLGGISPHHPDCSSPDGQPSYGQLNFRENIARFLLSGIDQAEPVPGCNTRRSENLTTSEKRSGGLNSGSGSGGEWTGSSDIGGANGSQRGRGSGDSASGADSGGSSGTKHSPSTAASARAAAHACNGFHAPFFTGLKPLTKEVLCRHNEDMAKKLILKHKERAKDVKTKKDIGYVEVMNHGVKRCGSDSWKANKMLKHLHVDVNSPEAVAGRLNQQRAKTINSGDKNLASLPLNPSGVGLWPTVNVPAIGMPALMYYIPTDESQSSLLFHQVSSESQSMIAPPTLVPTIKPVPLINTFAMFAVPPVHYHPVQKTPAASAHPMNLKNFRRPPSQATSVKPELGSTRGSGIMSEGSKNGRESEYDSTPADDGKGKDSDLEISNRDTATGYESSFSLSSFLKTDSGSNQSTHQARPVKQEPPWLKNVNMNKELMFNYEMTPQNLETTLAADNMTLLKWSQSNTVEKQLQHLYLDLEKAGVSDRLQLSYENSSSSDDDAHQAINDTSRWKKCHCDYTKLTMIHEELIWPREMNEPSAVKSTPSVAAAAIS